MNNPRRKGKLHSVWSFAYCSQSTVVCIRICIDEMVDYEMVEIIVYSGDFPWQLRLPNCSFAPSQLGSFWLFAVGTSNGCQNLPCSIPLLRVGTSAKVWTVGTSYGGDKSLHGGDFPRVAKVRAVGT